MMSVPETKRIDREIKGLSLEKNYQHWVGRNTDFISNELFLSHKETWLDMGAGTGDFFMNLAPKNPEVHFIAVERGRMRAKTLLKRAANSEGNNFTSFRGNIIPALVHGIKEESLDRLFILYPCPWPKNPHRKNRWPLSPVMPRLFKILKKGGLLIWATDQKFYIEEAHYVCEKHHQMKTLAYGEISPNKWNGMKDFPLGRTKFERTFLSQNQPCYELVAQRPLG